MHTIPPRPALGAQLVKGWLWLPDKTTEAPYGVQQGSPPRSRTTPTSKS